MKKKKKKQVRTYAPEAGIMVTADVDLSNGDVDRAMALLQGLVTDIEQHLQESGNTEAKTTQKEI